jgi:hypothetical protein
MTENQDQGSLVGSGATDVAVAAIAGASGLGSSAMIAKAQIVTAREATKRAKLEAKKK